jgi:hypothetical protein
MFDLQQATFEDIMREHWHPSIRIGDIIERAKGMLDRMMVPMEEVPGKVLKRVQLMESNTKNPLF